MTGSIHDLATNDDATHVEEVVVRSVSPDLIVPFTTLEVYFRSKLNIGQRIDSDSTLIFNL